MASTLLACPISPGARGCVPRCSAVAVGLAVYGLVSQWDAGASRAGAAGRMGRGRRRGVRDSRARLHDAGLAGPARRSRLAAAAARGDPGDVRRATRQVRAGRGVGRGRAGRAGPRLRRPAPAQRHREPGQHGGHAGGRAGGRGRDAAAGLGARGPAVLVGAGRHPLAAACLYPPVIKFGLDLVLRVLGQGAAGGFGQPGRHGPGAGLDHARLALLRRARLVPDQRVRREGRQHVRAGAGRLRAGLGGRLPDHLLPRRHRAAGGRAHRRARPGHAVGVRAGRRARLAGGDDRRRPGLGRGRAGHRPVIFGSARASRPAEPAGKQPSPAPGPRA